MNALSYLFWPNPGNALYSSPKIVFMFIFCGVLVLVSLILLFWRRRLVDGQLKKCSRSWSSATFWFGIVGIVLAVSRVEQIQFLSMRVIIFVWILALIAYTLLQFKFFRLRYFRVIPKKRDHDPRIKYLPKKK